MNVAVIHKSIYIHFCSLKSLPLQMLKKIFIFFYRHVKQFTFFFMNIKGQFKK